MTDLCVAAVAAHLAPAADWQAPLVWPQIDSTQTQMRQLLLSSTDVGPKWRLMVADQQSQGRGRGGAQWMAYGGAALLMTLAGPLDLLAQHWPKLSLVAGWTVLEELLRLPCLAHLPPGDLRLKWPNDLLVRRGSTWLKLAGILTERLERAAAAPQWLCGLGLNLSAVPPALADTAACLSDVALGPIPPRDLLAGQLASALAQSAQALAHRQGALPMAQLQSHLAFVGERVLLDLGAAEGQQWVELHGITASGALYATPMGDSTLAPRPYLPLAILEAQPSGWRAPIRTALHPAVESP